MRVGVASLFLLFPFAWSGSARAAPPAYLTAARSCAVVVGGSVGSFFADPSTAAFWHEANKQITDRLFESLVRDRYHAIKLTIPVEGHGTLERMVGLAMARGECNRILQVSHTVGDDLEGPYFQISLTLLRVRTSGKSVPASERADVITLGDFNRDYRYRRDGVAFDAFRTGSFAREAYRDLKASGHLERLR